MKMKRAFLGACAASVCLGTVSGLRGEDLLGPTPPPPAPKPTDAPKPPPEAAKPSPSVPAQPQPAAPKPVEPETTAAIPADGKRSHGSASQRVQTGPGVRIVKFAVPDKTTAFFDIELWVSNGTWVTAKGVSVQKGERIIGRRIRVAPTQPPKDFETPWKLIDIKPPKTVKKPRVVQEHVLEADGKTYKQDAGGGWVMKSTTVFDDIKVVVVCVQHLWAKEKESGKPVVRELEYPPPPEGLSLPDFPDQKPPVEPSGEAP